MNISDQTILISGGAGAIGRYVVNELSKMARYVIALDQDTSALNVLKENSSNIDLFTCDLINQSDVLDCLESIHQKYTVTVLINLAGLIHSEPLINLLSRDKSRHSYETWDRVIKSNLYTSFNLTSVVAEKMVKSRTKGLIINISSIAAQGNVGQSAYSAAKAGVEAMTKVWSMELGVFKIRSACIAPGFFNTTSTSNSLSDSMLEKWKKQTPLGRLGEMNEFVSAIKFIVDNDFYTGKTLHLDGGLNM